jgi:MFS family permease
VASLGRSFWILWGASALTNVTDGMLDVAFSWMGSMVTRDPLAVSLLGASSSVAWLAFVLPAGVVVDRVDRRRLVVVSDVVRAVLMTLLALSVYVAVQRGALTPTSGEGGTVSGLYVLLVGAALVLGIAQTLRDSAAQALLPRVVPGELLDRANGRLWAVELVGQRMLGPGAGGALLAGAPHVAFLLNAIAFAASALGFSVIRVAPAPAEEPTPEVLVPRAKTSMWSEVGAGLRWLRAHPTLWPLAMGVACGGSFSAMSHATFVLFAQEVLGAGPFEYAVLLAGPALGGVAGSFLAEHTVARVGRYRTLVGGLTVSLFALGAVGLSHDWRAVFVLFTVLDLAIMHWNIVSVTYRQRAVPDALLGRVSSAFRLFGWGSVPLGYLLGGLVVELAEPALGRQWALRAPILLATVAHVPLVAYVALRLRGHSLEPADPPATP